VQTTASSGIALKSTLPQAVVTSFSRDGAAEGVSAARGVNS
jgi:hypothetical protein